MTYQTIYAEKEGSVAAPTAGLHFTDLVMNQLSQKNIDLVRLLLHVGAGTFKPVSSPALSGHSMHSEKVSISREALARIIDNPGKSRIVVGTTSTRLLESLYWLGVKWNQFGCNKCIIDIHQWEPYDQLHNYKLPVKQSLEVIIKEMDRRGKNSLDGETSLIIAPGYEYQIPDILITNFHQPRSTLLLLIAAFIGEGWREAYQYALENQFRFLSYGDSCLFFKQS
jgi:S-adenosylmethionine:tRNA ribosyltransferase-isomerase